MNACTILSIQVGMPRVMVAVRAADGVESEWESGIFKQTVSEPVHLGLLNLDGDGQSDLVHHGGLDRAVLIYSALHYRASSEFLGRELEPGSFGENLVVDTLTELDVCIGDWWETDIVTLEISQPRIPCYKLGRRLDSTTIAHRVMETGQGGWYARIIREGLLSPGDQLRLVERPHPDWNIARGFEIYVRGKDRPHEMAELAALPEISELWRDSIGRRLS